MLSDQAQSLNSRTQVPVTMSRNWWTGTCGRADGEAQVAPP